MDENTRAQIKEFEAHSRFPTGIGRIDRGECPTGALNPIACMFCPFGHMLECHYPYTCEHVECSHYQSEMEAERRLTWTCHICGDTRPDDKISVLSKPLVVGGIRMRGQQNIRYCNDRQECIDGAKDFSFFKEESIKGVNDGNKHGEAFRKDNG